MCISSLLIPRLHVWAEPGNETSVQADVTTHNPTHSPQIGNILQEPLGEYRHRPIDGLLL